MFSVEQITKQLKARLAADPRRGTPEQIEAAYRKTMQKNIDCRVDCPICGGGGWVKSESGKSVRCPSLENRARFQGERYGMSDEERDLRWEKVLPVDGVQPALAALRRVMQRGAGWVYLWGPPGLAKTLILKTTVAVSLNAGQEAAYTRMAQILDDMRAAFSSDYMSQDSQRRLDWWANLPLLAIDEFDRLRATEFATERRFLLMDRRYESALRAGASKLAYGAAGGSGASKLACGAAGRGGASKLAYGAAGGSGAGKLVFDPAGRGVSITLMAGNEDPARLDSYLYDRIRDGRFEVVRLTGESLRPAMEWG